MPGRRRKVEASGADWKTVGASVVHSSFGTGTVVHVGSYNNTPAVWVDFDRGDLKMLDPQYADAHIRVRTKSERTSPVDSNIRCDECGGRPVTVTVAGPQGSQQFCERHTDGRR